jgi:hypothetical protein
MNKSYFTKYLPCEGEIKEGDRAITARGEIFVATKENNDPIYGDKLLKLYLCSRDIKVGDKIYPGPGEKYHFKEYECVEKSCSGSSQVVLEWALEGKWFKKIGEISPESLSWVKEGMEFDEDEAEVFNQLPSSPFGDQSLIPLYYMIKCPNCKHFH